jgi:hypothetical protein
VVPSAVTVYVLFSGAHDLDMCATASTAFTHIGRGIEAVGRTPPMGKTVGSMQRLGRSGRGDGAMRGIIVLVVCFAFGLPACAAAQAPLTRAIVS